MIKCFKEFVIESLVKADKSRFVGLMLSEDSQKKMSEWCKANGFLNTKSFSGKDIKPKDFDFHFTVIYSSNKSAIPTGEWDIDPIEITFDHFEMLGKENNIPVLKLKKSKELKEIRKTYEDMGLKDDWPEWKPHVSLSYNKENIPDISKLSIPDFKVYSDKLKVEENDE